VHPTTGILSRTRGALRLLGGRLGVPLVGPRTAGLEVTHYCNLGCSFCETHGRLMPAPITKRREYVDGRHTMDLATIARLTRSLARCGVEWVELSGKGDPIVHPQIPEIVRLVKGAGLRCSMFTNGTVKRPGLTEALVETGLDRINQSLNAGSREVFERTTGKDLWDQAVAFLDDLMARRAASGGTRPWVRLTFVVCKDNVEDMEHMVDFCIGRKVDEGGWSIMGELPQTTPIQLDRSQAHDLLERLPGWIARLEAAGVAHDLRPFAEDLDLRIGKGPQQENPLQRQVPCYEGWMHTVIGPDGTVAPCCYCENVRLGNVGDGDFGKVWYGEAYARFRRESLDMPATQKQICKECFTSCNRALENRRMDDRLRPLMILPRLHARAPAPKAAPPRTAGGPAKA
jgi:radical SAM protein with 4Fe4S-binding SPASM domain